MSLSSLLKPRTVAVVGASPDPDTLAGQCVANLLRYGFDGAVYPVNERHVMVQGLRCYPSLGALPGSVDVALILVRADRVLPILRDTVAKGIRHAIVFSSGFAEIGHAGTALQSEMTSLARLTGLRILGPNCNGIINPVDRAVLCMFFFPDLDRLLTGEIAVISQSGNVPLLTLRRAYERHIGFRAGVATGNEADLDLTDFAAHFVADPQTRVVAAYVEGLRDVAKFTRVADRAWHLGKPLIVLHATTTERARLAAQYHTAAWTEPGHDLAGTFRDTRVVLVEEMDELFEFGFLFARSPVPRGSRVGIVNSAGGVTVLTARVSDEQGLTLSDFAPHTRAFLSDALRFAGINNPMDLTGQVAKEPELYKRVLDAFVDDPNFDLLVVTPFTVSPSFTAVRIENLLEVARNTDKPIVVLWTGGDLHGPLVHRLIDGGIPVFGHFRPCFRAVRAFLDYHALRRSDAGARAKAGSCAR